jgi:ankyrin repeat protein
VLEAVYEQNHALLAELAEAEVDLEIREDMKVGRMAIHIACFQGDVESVRILLAHGVDVNAADLDDRSGLFHAALGKQLAMI